MAEGRFGLRFFRNGKEVRLMQISGGGRIRVSDGDNEWWCKMPVDVEWEVFETAEGQRYESHDLAMRVAGSLTV